MAVSRIEILNHALPRAFRGYAMVEVDRLLQDASDSLARLSDEKVALMNRVTQLEAALAEFRQREGAMREAIVAAQRMREEMRAQTQKEAQLVLETAHTRAETMVNQATLRLARLLEEIAEARKTKARFAMQIRAVAERHLQLLDLEAREDVELARELRPLSQTVPAVPATGVGRPVQAVAAPGGEPPR